MAETMDGRGQSRPAAGGPPAVTPVLDIAELCPPGSAIRRELVACLAQMFREAVGAPAADELIEHVAAPATDHPAARQPAARQPHRHRHRQRVRRPTRTRHTSKAG